MLFTGVKWNEMCYCPCVYLHYNYITCATSWIENPDLTALLSVALYSLQVSKQHQVRQNTLVPCWE